MELQLKNQLFKVVSPEAYGERDDVDEGIHLEHTEEEYSEVLKRLSEEVPEQAEVGSLVRDREPVRVCGVRV